MTRSRPSPAIVGALLLHVGVAAMFLIEWPESEVEIQRAPIEFLEIELAILEEMGLDFTLGALSLSPGDAVFAPVSLTTTAESIAAAAIDLSGAIPATGIPVVDVDDLLFEALTLRVADKDGLGMKTFRKAVVLAVLAVILRFSVERCR